MLDLYVAIMGVVRLLWYILIVLLIHVSSTLINSTEFDNHSRSRVFERLGRVGGA